MGQIKGKSSWKGDRNTYIREGPKRRRGQKGGQNGSQKGGRRKDEKGTSEDERGTRGENRR